MQSGSLDDSWPYLIGRIVGFYKGDLNKRKIFATHCTFKMLKDRVVSWSVLKQAIGPKNDILCKLMDRDGFFIALERNLKAEGIIKLNDDEAQKTYGRRNLYQRLE